MPVSERVETIIGAVRAEGRTQLTEHESMAVLESCGIPVVARGAASSREEAAHLADELGYPVVMKVLSADLGHKTDVGGVKLDLFGEGDVVRAFDEIMEAVGAGRPEARIMGVSVQRQVNRGTELIIGGLRDPHFGPVVMFGLGGIYTDVLADVAFRLAPLEEDAARDLMQETAAYRMLTGIRGDHPADLDQLARTICTIGDLLVGHEVVEEVEMNPFVIPTGGSPVAVDALITLGESCGEGRAR